MRTIPEPQCAKEFVVIVGAGPAGLATAARLLHASVPFVVLERAATAGASWRHRYHRLHLHTHSSYSSLPFFPFPDHFPDFVSAQDLADYYEGVAAHMSEHIRYGAEVVDVELRQLKVPGGGGRTQAKVKLASGETYSAAALVVATGQEGTPHVPKIPGADTFGGKTMHSSEWVSGTEYANKTALVVGFGNSGSEIALDLWEGGAKSVTALVRSPIHMLPRDLVVAFKRPFWFAPHYFPVWLGDLIATKIVYPLLYSDIEKYGLRLKSTGPGKETIESHKAPVQDLGTYDLIRRGEIDVVASPIARLTKSGAVFEDGTERAFDLIVFATGFDHTGAPHAKFLSKGVVSALGAHPESGRAAVAPALFLTGFSDHSGRLGEIAFESEAIAAELSTIVAPQPAERAGAARRRAVAGRPVCRST